MNDRTRPIVVVAIVLIAVIALPLLWGGMMMGNGNWGMGPGMMSGWGWDGGWSPWRMLLGMLPMVVILGGVAVAVLWAAGAFGQSTSATPQGTSPRAILDARYARGEIDREQYQQMRADLDS